MFHQYDITREDLRLALQRGVKLHDIERELLSACNMPRPDETATSPLFLLRRLAPDLESLVSQWMQGSAAEPAAKTPTLNQVVLIPYPSRGINVKSYLASLIKKHKPCIVAVDVSPAAVGAALTPDPCCMPLTSRSVLASAKAISVMKKFFCRREISFRKQQPCAFAATYRLSPCYRGAAWSPRTIKKYIVICWKQQTATLLKRQLPRTGDKTCRKKLQP